MVSSAVVQGHCHSRDSESLWTLFKGTGYYCLSQGAGHCLWVDVLTEFVFVHQPVGVIPLRYDGTTSWTGCHLDSSMQAGCCFISTQQHE